MRGCVIVLPRRSMRQPKYSCDMWPPDRRCAPTCNGRATTGVLRGHRYLRRGAPMECTHCLRTMAHSVLVRSVVDVDLCTGCAADLATRQSAATPLMVAALAQYLQEWGAAPSTTHQHDAARRFW